MMRTIRMTRLALLLLALSMWGGEVGAQQLHKIAGFEYGNMKSPTGREWESPTQLSYNKEQPRAYFFSFKSHEGARAYLP